MQERKTCERIRIIAVIGLIFVLIMTIAGGKTRVQAAGAALSVSSVSAEKGGTVTVNVSLSNNPGIWGIIFNLDYDKEALQLVSISNGTVFTSDVSSDVDTAGFAAFPQKSENTTANGLLATFEFKVKNEVNSGTYKVSVNSDNIQACNVSQDYISVSGGSGKVTVEKCIHNKKWKVTKAATCEEKGVQANVCTKCNESFETKEIAATGHKNTEIRNKVDATTTTEGYTGDTYCKDCGKLIASGTKIEKLPSKSDSPKSDEKAEVKKPDNNTTATAKNTEKKTEKNKEKKTSDSKKTKSKKTKENTADVAKTSEKETEKATEKASETELVTETESESEITETTEQKEKTDTMKDTKKEEVKKSSGVPKAAAVVVVIAVIGAIGAGLYFFVIRKKPGR